MKRPITFITIFLCLGIICTFYFSSIYSVILVFLGVFLFNISLYIKYSQKYILLLYLFFILGVLNTPSKISLDFTQTHEIKGYVKEIKTYENYNRLIIKTSEINGINQSIKINAITYNKNINFLDEIIFETTLKPFEKQSYKYIQNLSENILFECTINDITLKGTHKNYLYYTSSLVEKLSKVYDNIFPENESGIVKALVLGQKNTLDMDTILLYIKGGIFHILALSGLHIFIIMYSLFLVLSYFINGYFKNIIVILFLIFYLFLTGNSISTTRAVIMATCLLIAPLLKREYDTLSSIFLSGFIILLIYPYSLFSLSFILTYLSVLTISIISVKIELVFSDIAIKSNSKILNFINSDISNLSSFISIYIVINIILAYYFYYFYPYSIFINILISIFVTPLIILSFMSGILGLIYLPLGKFLGASVYFILQFFYFVCNLFNKLPFSEILVGKPRISTVIIYFAFLYVILCAKKHKKIFIPLLISAYILLNIIYNNTIVIQIFNQSNNVFINNNSLILLDNKTKSFYNTKNYVLENKQDYVSTIVTTDISATTYLYENNMLKNVYISENNPLLEELKQKDIEIITFNENEFFNINGTFILVNNNNIYVELNNYIFVNVTDDTNLYSSSIQNRVQNDSTYDILIYEQDEIKNFSGSLDEIKIYIFNDLVLIR